MFFRMVYKSEQIFLPFCHNTRVWQTDRRTDRQTDRQTDRILITIPRLHYMQRGKNQICCLHQKRECSIFSTNNNVTKFLFLSNYLIFDKQFITYIVILYNDNSFTEIKNLRWSWPLRAHKTFPWILVPFIGLNKISCAGRPFQLPDPYPYSASGPTLNYHSSSFVVISRH